MKRTSGPSGRKRLSKRCSLVIGSDGFVGEPLCRHLESLGERVVRFDLKRSAREDGREAKLPLAGVDAVYFLAWDVGGAKYLYRDEMQFVQLDNNLRLMLNIFPQLRGLNIPFLFVSSQLAEEYDTVYGATKRLGEVWSHLLNGTRVRLWNVYGAYEPFSERSHVVADFVWQALTKGEIRMLTTGEERRQFVHIDDVCRGFHAALGQRLGDVCDVTSFEWVKVRRVAEIIGSLTGAAVVPGTKVGSTPITPIKGKIPGWIPQVDIEAGLARMVAEFRHRLPRAARPRPAGRR